MPPAHNPLRRSGVAGVSPRVRKHLDAFHKLAIERRVMHLETRHRFAGPISHDLVIELHRADHEGMKRAAHQPPDGGSGA